MKDIAHHRQHAVRKVIQSVRREESQTELNGRNGSLKTISSDERSSSTNNKQYIQETKHQFT